MPKPQNTSLIDEYKIHVQDYSGSEDNLGSQAKTAITTARDLVAGSPDQYYGTSFVSSKLIKNSRSTYWIAVIANFINVLTSVPALYFGFSGIAFGPVLTLAVAIGLLKASNESASAASASAKGNRIWSSQGLIMFVGINVLLSAISGIGSEIMVNRQGLRRRLAAELLEKNMEVKPLNMDLYQAQVDDCEVLKSRYGQFEENDPRRSAPYYDAHGSYPDGSLKPCDFVNQKTLEAQEKVEAAESLKAERSQFGNDIKFLKAQFPDSYEAYFSEKGSILSGAEEFRLGLESFSVNLLSGDYSNMGNMGFSLFMFSLSVVTSVGACLMMVTHVYRKDTALSHNPYVRTAITEHLAYLRRAALGEAAIAPSSKSTANHKKVVNFPKSNAESNETTHKSAENAASPDKPAGKSPDPKRRSSPYRTKGGRPHSSLTMALSN